MLLVRTAMTDYIMDKDDWEIVALFVVVTFVLCFVIVRLD